MALPSQPAKRQDPPPAPASPGGEAARPFQRKRHRRDDFPGIEERYVFSKHVTFRGEGVAPGDPVDLRGLPRVKVLRLWGNGFIQLAEPAAAT